MSNLIPFSIDNTSFNGVTRIRYAQFNFLSNADFEAWNNGTSVAPPAWVLYAGATVSQHAALSIGAYCAQVVFDATNTGAFYQSIPSNTNVDYTYSCYVERTSGSGTASLVARNGDSPYQSFGSCPLNVTGGIGLATLTVKPSAGANIRFSIEATSAATSTWLVDECMLQESQAVASSFTRAAIDDCTNQFVFGPKTWGGGQSTYSGGFKLYDTSGAYQVTFNAAGTATGNTSLTYPVTSDTIAVLGTNQTYTATPSFSGGTNTGGSATVTTPAFVSGTAIQVNTTKDVMLYIDVKTAASLTIALGSTSSVTTILQSAVVSSLGLTGMRVPAGWYVKLTGTMADLTITAITC